METWIGKTGQSFFDVWTLVHIAFWFVVGANTQAIRNRKKVSWTVDQVVGGIVIVWLLAVAWELSEQYYFETHGYVAHPEGWLNRWISDPLIGVGAWLGGVALIRKE